MSNPHDQINDYLEYIAGRRKKAPSLSVEDQDVLRAMHLLRHARPHTDPRPEFISTLGQKVMSQQPRPQTLSKKQVVHAAPTWSVSWWWLRLAPVMATAAIVLAMVQLPAGVNDFNWTLFRKSVIQEASAATITLVAADTTATGISPTTAFVVTGKDGTLTEEMVRKNLVFSPTIDAEIQAAGDNTYRLIPKTALDQSVVYAATYAGQAKATDGTLQARNYSWAFQVRRDFIVIGTYPRDAATYVEITSGLDITFSSGGVSVKDFEKALSIVPATPHTIEIHGRTMSIIPKNPLQERTIYTVTIKAGLHPDKSTMSLADDVVTRFETGTKDGSGTTTAFHSRSAFETVAPGDSIYFSDSAVPGDASNGTKDWKTSYEFAIYSFPSLETFKKAIETRLEHAFGWASFNEMPLMTVTGLSKVATVKTVSHDGVMSLPKSFAPGAYVAETMVGGVRTQMPFIVSDISNYTMSTATDTVVWVHHLSTKKPAVGATITLADNTTVKTDQEGLARFPTPSALGQSGAPNMVVRIAVGTTETLSVLAASNSGSIYYGRNYTSLDNYWAYLTTDRSLYRPTDTVHFWGLLQPRDTRAAVEKVSARLVVTNWDRGGAETVMKEVPVTLTADHTFIGEIPLREASVGWGKELRIYVGEQWVMTRYLDVQVFQTPAYQLSVTSDKPAVFDNEEVTWTVRASFFDGTPVPNLKVKLTTNGEYTLTTNAAGMVSKKVRLTMAQGGSASAVPVDDATNNIQGWGYVTVYPAARSIIATSSTTDSTVKVSGTVRTVNPTKVDMAASNPFAAVVGDPVANATVHVRLIKTTYTAVKNGQVYDFLTKQVVPKYQYTSSEADREALDVVTDGDGKFQYTFTAEDLSGYRVELTTTDEAGRTESQTLFPWFSYPSDAPAFSLTTFQPLNTPWKVGDAVTLSIVGTKKQEEAPKHLAYLYMLSQRGLKTADVSAKSTLDHIFTEADVPNVSARAVVFTGTGYSELNEQFFNFDSSTRALAVSLTTDQKSYEPGETITAHVKLRDADGAGVAGRVNVRAVDEAITNLQYDWGNDTPLTSLYRNVSSGEYGSYVSHQAFGRNDVMAEGGGGGDRIDFKDVAHYSEVQTDAAGNGTVTFVAPDNITSWRMVAQAISPDRRAGTATTLVAVTRPIFVRPDVPTVILASDVVDVQASVFGSAVTSGDTTNITFSIVGQTGTEKTVHGKVFTPLQYRLPKLPVGSYQVRMSASAKGHVDSVVMPYRVTTTTLTTAVTSVALLEKNETPLLSTSDRTDIGIGQADRMFAYAALDRLLWNSQLRLDDAVASSMAATLLREHFKKDYGTSVYDPLTFLTTSGVALYPVGSNDLEYGSLAATDTAMAAYRGQLVIWFRSALDNPKTNTEQAIYALYGLAQLHEPVLDQIHQYLDLEGITDQERLTLALALETLGAREEARPIATYLWETYGKSEAPYAWMTLGRNEEERRVQTGRFAILAAGLQLDTRYGLLQYIETHQPQDTTTHLEMALVAQRLLRAAGTSSVSVTYQLNGETKTATLARNESIGLSVDSTEAKTFTITHHTGNVVAVTHTTQSLSAANATDPKLSVTRRYSKDGKPTTSFTRGEIIRVDVSWSAKSGAPGTYYGVIDSLPTGLRPLSNQYVFGATYDSHLVYPMAIDSRRVLIRSGEKSFHYYVQAVLSGNYSAEPAMLQALDAPGSYTVSPASQGITIK